MERFCKVNERDFQALLVLVAPTRSSRVGEVEKQLGVKVCGSETTPLMSVSDANFIRHVSYSRGSFASSLSLSFPSCLVSVST